MRNRTIILLLYASGARIYSILSNIAARIASCPHLVVADLLAASRRLLWIYGRLGCATAALQQQSVRLLLYLPPCLFAIGYKKKIHNTTCILYPYFLHYMCYIRTLGEFGRCFYISTCAHFSLKRYQATIMWVCACMCGAGGRLVLNAPTWVICIYMCVCLRIYAYQKCHLAHVHVRANVNEA